MDERLALYAGAILNYDSISFTIREEIGRGSNAIVYLGEYQDPVSTCEKHTVLIKELFPYHEDGAIYRDDNNEIQCLEEGKALYGIHRESFLTGNDIHLKMLNACPESVETNLISFYLNNTIYTVMGYSAGRSLEAEMIQPVQNLKKLANQMLGLLSALKAFHNSGFLHLDVAADNTLLIGSDDTERVVLIDYNSAWNYIDGNTQSFPYNSIKLGYTAPEIRRGKTDSICRATDIYSVTALFYRCMAGTVLTPFQMTRATPPDITPFPCIKEQPSSVVSQVCKILFKGLRICPEQRYQTCEEMAEDFRELIARIEGRGVTHWAIWEAGQKTVRHLLKENSALHYLQNSKTMFPLDAVSSENQINPVGEWISNAIRYSEGNLEITGPGGMGKSTALLRYILDNGERYSPMSPAMVYIPLRSYHSGDRHYIADRTLETLRFNNEITTYESARHALSELLNKPIHFKNTNLPSVVFFLDGLNEAENDHQTLLDEIYTLSQNDGVRIIVTSRNSEESLKFHRIKISSLSEETVKKQLSRNGLLIPERNTVAELLRTPLMLSIYIQASKTEDKQLSISNERDLLDVYFASILEKEINSLAQDNDFRWQLEAAVELVLPALALHFKGNHGALCDVELLKLVKKCYGIVKSPFLRRTFAEWTGHSRAIVGDAKNAEEWYGTIVYGLLWQKLGLLVRDANGCYTIPHQILEDYLAEKGKKINVNVRNQHIALILLVTIISVTALMVGIWVFIPKPYDAEKAGNVIDRAFNNSIACRVQYRSALEVLSSFREHIQNVDIEIQTASFSFTKGVPDEACLLKIMLETGEEMPWSGRDIAGEEGQAFQKGYTGLATLAAEREENYSVLFSGLENMLTECTEQELTQWLNLTEDYLHVDAELLAFYYNMTIAQEKENMDFTMQEYYNKTESLYEPLATIEHENVSSCETDRGNLWAELAPVRIRAKKIAE